MKSCFTSHLVLKLCEEDMILITDSAEVWAGKIFLHPNDAFRLSIYGIHSKIDFEIFQKYVVHA